jgi:hypothetical protein
MMRGLRTLWKTNSGGNMHRIFSKLRLKLINPLLLNDILHEFSRET